jgi:hypothetical protein
MLIRHYNDYITLLSKVSVVKRPEEVAMPSLYKQR